MEWKMDTGEPKTVGGRLKAAVILRLREGGRSTENFDNGRASSVAAILGPFLC